MALVCVATLGLLAASGALGAAVWRLAGLPPAPHLTPAIGFAVLLVVALPAVRLPGWSVTALVILVLLALASLADRRAMAAVRGGLADALPVSLVALFVLCLPFLVSGHFGILAMGNNNDWSVHLGAVRWLAHHDIPARDTLAGWGYPMGPHALAAALTATGLSEAAAFTAVMATGPILAARAALAALLPVARPGRWALALLAGLPYLAVSYYAQAAYKEVIVGGLALAFALALPAAVRAAGDRARAAGLRADLAAARAALPLAFLFAGAVTVMSWPGALWPLATLGAWAALALLGPRRGMLWAARERVFGGLVGGAAAVAVMLAPDVHDIIAFQKSSFAHEPDQGLGNLVGPIPPHEGLGVWFQGDFRFATDLPGLAIPLIAGAGALIVVAAIHWLRRGPRVLAAALAADWVVWVALSVAKNPYNAAKGLAVMAPLMGLALVTGALVAWAPRARRAAPTGAGAAEAPLPVPVAAATYAVLGGVPGRRPRAAALRRAAVAAVLVAAGASSFLAARDAVVGVDAHAEELHSLAATAQRDQTAFLDPSDYGVWDLYSLRPFRPPLLYVTHGLPLRPEKDWHQGAQLDFDSLSADTINRFRWFIVSNTTYASTPPKGLRLVRSTRSWQLWERTATVQPRETLPQEHGAPGAVLDCTTPAGRALSRRRGAAIVRAEPVVGPTGRWSGDARDAGSTVSQVVDLPAGRWDLSLQYVSRNPIDVGAGALHATLPANLDRMSPFFAVGTVTSSGGPTRVTVHVRDLNAFGRALGARGRTRALGIANHQALGAVAATRHGDAPRTIPLSRACGRYVDAYTLG